MINVTHIDSNEIRIRAAHDSDMPEIARVAGRDTHELPAKPLMVATVGEQVRAAISLADGTHVADPFHHTSELVAMLRIRADAVQASHNGVARKRSGRRILALSRAA